MSMNNKVILDIATYQETFKKIERLENTDSQQEILKLNEKIQNLENQNKILLDKIEEQERCNNLLFYEQSLHKVYEKKLNRLTSLSLTDRIFKYKKIKLSINTD